MREILTALGFTLIWVLAVIAAALVEAVWFPEPDLDRNNFSTIETYLVEQLNQAIEGKRLGSASLVLVQNGAIVAKHGFGVANSETRARAKPEQTLYQTASVSKAVTAWGVLRLVEEGKVGLDEPVLKYLTRWSFPENDEYRDKVTVRHLLTHTAGLDEGSGLRGFLPGENLQSLEEILASTVGSSPGQPNPVRVVEEPGKGMSYGNANYAILQLLIEEITQRPFADYMKEAVLLPLGMTKSEFGMEALAAEDRHQALAPNFDSSLNEQPRRRYTASAAVALYATAEDLAHFARAFSGENPVLKQETLRQMLTPQNGTAGTWGLGPTLFVDNGAGGHIAGHDGGAYPAWGAIVRTNPATGNSFVLLVSGGRGAVNRLSHDWVYWETGKMTSDGRRQVFYDRMKVAGLGAIFLGGLLLVLWRIRVFRRRGWRRV